MTIQKIREAGHPEIAELAELRKEFEGKGDNIHYCFSWCDTKEGFDFWDLVSERSYKKAYKIVPLEKIKKRIMKKDRIKEICKEAFKELIDENKNEVKRELMIKIIKWCYREFTMGTLTDEEANAILEEWLTI